MKKLIYQTIEEAQLAILRLGIRTRDAYRTGYRRDPLLPKSPHVAYAHDWVRIGKWRGYLQQKYSTWQEAAVAARTLHIKTAETYAVRYRRDPRLPAHPWTFYLEDWKPKGCWQGFLDTKFYRLLQEAQRAAQRLKITSIPDYKARYWEDPRLPSTPGKVYPRAWKKYGRWKGFLGL